MSTGRDYSVRKAKTFACGAMLLNQQSDIRFAPAIVILPHALSFVARERWILLVRVDWRAITTMPSVSRNAGVQLRACCVFPTKSKTQ
jgi:hypothetical protein